MAGSAYTQKQKDEALTLYETDGPTAVEKHLGIPKNTVAGWARKAGIKTVRNERTRDAVEAKIADGKNRRQGIIHRLYGQSEKILDDLEAELFTTILKGEYGAESKRILDFVPPADRRTLLQALNTAMTTAANTEKIDSDNGAGVVGSMLESLINRIGVPDE